MSMMSRRHIVTVPLLLAAGVSRTRAAVEDIVIGFHGPLTGAASWVGLGGRDGAQLAVNEINAAGGVNGRRLRLMVYDDANQPSQAEAAFRKMADGDKVFAVIGGAASNTAVAVAQEAARAKIPYLNGASSSPKIVDLRSRWVISGASPDNRDLAQNEAAFVGRYLKPKKVAYLYSADEFSTNLSAAVIDILKTDYNIETTKQQTYNRGDTDFSAQVIGLRRNAPDLLLLAGPYLENARIIRQTRELGIRVPIKGDSSSMNSGLITIAGPAAEGLYVSYMLPYFNGDPAEPMVRFEARYKAAYPSYPADRPNYVDIECYGNIYALAEALKRAGPDMTPKGLIMAFETLDHFQATQFWSGAADVIMPLSLTSSHVGNRLLRHFVVRNGAFVRVTDFTPPEPSTVFPADATLSW